MLHIFLGILKVIGILIGIVFLLVAGILLAIVFVPLRYRLKAAKEPERIHGMVQVSWLLHVVSASVVFSSPGSREIIIRLFGIRLPLFRTAGESSGSGKKQRSGIKRKRGKNPAPDRVEAEKSEPAEPGQEEPISEVTVQETGTAKPAAGDTVAEKPAVEETEPEKPEEEEPGQERIEEEEPGQGKPISEVTEQEAETAKPAAEESGQGKPISEVTEQEAETAKPAAEESGSEKTAAEETEQENIAAEEPEPEIPGSVEPESEEKEPPRSLFQKIWYACRNICDRIGKTVQRLRQLPEKLAAGRRRLKENLEKFEKLLQKPGQLLDMAAEYEIKEVLGGLTGEVFYLLLHYKPRRIRGYLKFGTGDPALTGQLTGIVYLLLPAGADRFVVAPDFYTKMFETEVVCEGHIRTVHVLCVLWRQIRDKKVRRLINKLRKRGK